MRQSERDKRTYLIIGLCAVLVVMAIGFAAFSQQLQINGTSNITSTWNVQITSITRFASSGAGVSDASGSPSYDNTNGLTATFNTNLTSPGDYAIYKIKVENLGSLNAVLSDITLISDSSNDITYYVNKNQNNSDITDTDRLIDEDDVLNPTGDTNDLDEGYVYVTVKYNDYEGQTSPTGDNKTVSATVKLDFVQSNSSATVPTPATAEYYVFDSNGHSVNGSFNAAGLTPGTFPSGKNIAVKYVVSGTTITEAYVCTKFSFIDEPVCLQGGHPSYYGDDEGEEPTGNIGILGGLLTAFRGQGGDCEISNDSASCYDADYYFDINADPAGFVSTNDATVSEYCSVSGNNGTGFCGTYS